MELVDTIELMIDDSYANRFRAEYYQLAIRTRKLNKYINDVNLGLVEEEPKTEVNILLSQLHTMKNYLTILKHRAKVEGIELEEVWDGRLCYL